MSSRYRLSLAFADLETSGLSPWPDHEPWEATALIVDPYRVEITWQLPIDLGRADPAALRINRFHERRWKPAASGDERRTAVDGVDTAAGEPVGGPETGFVVHPDDMHLWAARFVQLTSGRALVGANVSFDMKDHLDRLLRRHGACPMYHHRPVCTEAALWGYLNGRLDADKDLDGRPSFEEKMTDIGDALDVPWSHQKLLDAAMALFAVDLNVRPEDRHTSLGDCRLVEGVHELITRWQQ